MSDDARRGDLDRACERVLGAAPDGVTRAFLTAQHEGDVRGTVRLSVGGRTVYATQRRNPEVTTRPPPAR